MRSYTGDEPGTFLQLREVGGGQYLPPRNGAMLSSAGWAAMRVRIAGIHKRPTPSAPPQMIRRRFANIILEPKHPFRRCKASGVLLMEHHLALGAGSRSILK